MGLHREDIITCNGDPGGGCVTVGVIKKSRLGTRLEPEVCMKEITLLLLLAGASMAQETRHEIVNAAPTPAEDAKGLSDQVPDVYAIRSQFNSVLVLRFKFKTDLLTGLEKMVKQEKVKNAIIL